MSRGDDLQPTHDAYNTIADYQCPNEIMTIASQTSQMDETRPILLKSFKIKVKILKGSSSPLKTVVHDLTFKTSSFDIRHLYNMLFKHLKAI